MFTKFFAFLVQPFPSQRILKATLNFVKTMKKAISIFGLLLFVAATSVIGQTKELESFSRLDVESIFDVFLTEGNQESIRLEMEGYDESDIIVEVRGSTLHLEMRGNNYKQNRNRYVRAYVTFKQLEEITASGSSDVIVENDQTIKGKYFDLRLSGASDFQGDFEVENLKVTLSGSSDAVMSGTSEELDLRASGSSDYLGYKLKCETAYVDVSGASDAEVYVTGRLEAKATGASDVEYRGKPEKVTARASGAADIEPY